HQENPDKDRQRKWGNECTFVLKAIFYSFIDELDDHLNEVEETGGNTCVGFFSGPTKEGDKDQTQADRPGHGIEVDGIKAHGCHPPRFHGLVYRPGSDLYHPLSL